MLKLKLNKKVLNKSFKFISFTLTILAIVILVSNYFINKEFPDFTLVFLILISSALILPAFFISFLILSESINNLKNKPTERFEILKKIGFKETWNDNPQFFTLTKFFILEKQNLSFICDNKSENLKLITSSNSKITNEIKNEILQKKFEKFRIIENQILEKEFTEINIDEVKNYIDEISTILNNNKEILQTTSVSQKRG